jgi:hypothetical protein
VLLLATDRQNLPKQYAQATNVCALLSSHAYMLICMEWQAVTKLHKMHIACRALHRHWRAQLNVQLA